MVNYNDVAGAYAGYTFGLANTFGTVSGNYLNSLIFYLKFMSKKHYFKPKGIVAPYLVGALTTHVRFNIS
jgi:hypothetical protein